MPRADRAGGETLNHGFKARFGFEQQDRDQTFCLIPVLLFNAEDGTCTHTIAIITRSLVLLVCQFRHFRMYFVFAACLTRLVYNIRLFSKMQALFSKKSYFFTGSFHSTKTAAQTGCIHPLYQIQILHTSAEPSH